MKDQEVAIIIAGQMAGKYAELMYELGYVSIEHLHEVFDAISFCQQTNNIGQLKILITELIGNLNKVHEMLGS